MSINKYPKFCINCGTKLTISNKFCPSCGFRIVTDSPEEALEKKYAISRKNVIVQPKVKLITMLKKDKRNLYTFSLTLVSLLFIIIGVYPMVLMLYLFGVLFAGFEGLIIVTLLFILIFLMQGIIIYIVVMSIKNKGDISSIDDIEIKKPVMISSGINHVFIIIVAITSLVFFYAPINGIILIISPLLNIVAVFIFQEYDLNKNE